MATSLTDSEQAHIAATKERIRIENLKDDFIRDQIRIAKMKAEDVFGGDLAAAVLAEKKALILREKEDIAITSANPLAGRKVARRKYSRYSARSIPSRFEYGRLEVMTHETEVSKTLRFSRPSVGELFVRVLKSDGTPSKRVDNYGKHEWKLVDD